MAGKFPLGPEGCLTLSRRSALVAANANRVPSSCYRLMYVLVIRRELSLNVEAFLGTSAITQVRQEDALSCCR